jgi:glutathione S-transferase
LTQPVVAPISVETPSAPITSVQTTPSAAKTVDVLLHQWEISPYCGKVRKLLRLKRIAFEVRNYNGLLALKAAKLSQGGKLPVLDWGSQRVADSSAIAAFVDQQQPDPPLMPTDPREAAHARLYEDWADESLYAYLMYFRIDYAQPRARTIELLCEGRPAWERAVFGTVYTRRTRSRLDQLGFTRRDGTEIEATYLRLIDDIDIALRDRDWLVGATQSIADIAVSAQLDEVIRNTTMADRILLRPNVARWLERQTG